MSGAAGGNRIQRSDVKPTVEKYQKEVLSLYDAYQKSVITGSFNVHEKSDFGDIDLIVQLNDIDKIEAKKHFSEFLTTLSTNIIVPFKSQKYKGKRFLNTGEIVTVLYPVVDDKGFVQIDNIISLSSKETTFKNEFLSLPAIKQGLMLGLIKTVVLENPKRTQKYLISYPLKHNQEMEFNLSSSSLTLRIVDLDPNYKTLDKKDVWKTTDWNVVKYLLSEYDFSKPFEKIVEDIKKNLNNKRSLNRIKGVFKSMVSIKSGEVDTPKGQEKQYALDLISRL